MQRIATPCVDKLSRVKETLASKKIDYKKLVPGVSMYHHNEPFDMVHGSLRSFDIAYESWGELNKEKSNVVLLHTGLSASSHAKSHEKNPSKGWWERFIGPGAPLDTNKYHIICTNVLGGCFGSTGPCSMTSTGPFGTRFPLVTIFDMVRAQFKLLDYLGIDKLHASIGSSMGGMQSLTAGVLFPDRVSKVISISAAARSHPFSIAMRYAQRQALMMDPNWEKGFYYDKTLPHAGLKLARQIATITYRSGPEWESRFSRKRSDPSSKPSFCADYLVESYLDHQSDKWISAYDPNSFLYISKAMDMFDLSHPIPQPGSHTDGTPSLEPEKCFSPEIQQEYQLKTSEMYDDKDALTKGLLPLQMPTLIMGAQSDILFPIWQQKEIADCLKKAGNNQVTYYELDALYGHDTFLIERVGVGAAIKGHLEL